MIRVLRYFQPQYMRMVTRYDICWMDGNREVFATYTVEKNQEISSAAISGILLIALKNGAYNFEKLSDLTPIKTEHLNIPSWYYL